MKAKNARALRTSTKNQHEKLKKEEHQYSSSLRSFNNQESSFNVPYMELQGPTNRAILGEGKFCSVFSSTMPESPDRKVAVKLQKTDDTQAASDIYKEAAILAHLQQQPNNHVVRLQGVSHPSSLQVFIVMDAISKTLLHKLEEWQKTESLLMMTRTTMTTPTTKSRLQRGIRCRQVFLGNHLASFRERHQQSLYRMVDRLEVAIDLAQAIQFVHNNGVVHRDIKPSNIGLNEWGQVRLIDFGLSERVTASANRLSGVVGSRSYMAPEVVSGSTTYSSNVDVYSFGVVLWEMCFLEPASSRVKFGVSLPIPDGWPQPLQQLLRDCSNKYPSKRPDWDAVVDGLKQSIDVIIKAVKEESESSTQPGHLVQQFKKLFQRRTRIGHDSAQRERKD